MAEQPDFSGQVARQIQEQAKKLGVDPDFAARIGYQESRFQPGAVSGKGAQGTMQVMPATSKDLAKRYGPDNIAQGVGYLKELGDIFDSVPEAQRPHFIAAAYNAGPTRIMGLMEQAKGKGLDPYDIASLADSLPHETLNYIANVAQGGQPAKQLTPPEAVAPEAAPAPTTRRIEPLGQAVMSSLAAQGERQLGRVGELQEATRGLVNPPSTSPEGPGILDALRASGRFLAAAPGAVLPIIAAPAVAGEVGGETLARTGALPVSPETGAAIGGAVPAAVSLLPGIARGGARLLSPALRRAERVAAATGEQAAASAGQAQQLAARPAAGAAAQQVAEDVQGRLASGAGFRARTAERAQPGALAQQPTRAQAATPPTTTTTTSPLVNAQGRPITTQVTTPGTPAVAAKTLTERDYNTTFQTFRRSAERAGQTAMDFDRQVTQKLSNLGPVSTAKRLASDPDLLQGILAHATPGEAAILNRAVEAGRSVSKLPYTAAELQGLGNEMMQGRGILSALTHFGLGGAGLGAFTGHGPAAAGTAAAIILGRLGLKALDVALGSRPAVAAMRGLAQLSPGAPDVARLLGSIGAEIGGPRRLQAKE